MAMSNAKMAKESGINNNNEIMAKIIIIMKAAIE
jgi:hypothetical protein